jgi:hypothetical protein
MTIEKLDFIFPFVVFFYGAVMTLVLNHPAFMQLAEAKFPPQLLQQMRGHRTLGIICLVVGSIWTLQNLWFNNPLF